ncbi:hypothetical protein, partial [Janthinobacterium sp.]|uniref:hypothetical protein n=1 Tax=Janthinobacterium sp. TaxID=1871054 RepID=UPI00289D6D00
MVAAADRAGIEYAFLFLETGKFCYLIEANCYIIRLLRSDGLLPRWEQAVEKVMPDDHSKLVPPLPIPN